MEGGLTCDPGAPGQAAQVWQRHLLVAAHWFSFIHANTKGLKHYIKNLIDLTELTMYISLRSIFGLLLLEYFYLIEFYL